MCNLKFISWTYLFFLLYDFCLAVSFTVEEMKWVNYEVDILQTPVKKGAEESQPVMRMTSKYGQEYQCLLPELKEDDASEKETVNEKNTDIKQLLKPMQAGSCLLKGKDWWTYEFCFGHYIKQFHIEDGQIIGQILTLGLYESDYDWNNETDLEKFKQVKQKYHSQYYTNGTKCDLTGQPRNAEVRFYCEEDAGDYIYRVDEPGTCSYIITIHTSRLCSHPELKPLPSNKAYSIPCHPVLNEEQYSQYLRKLKEENALAEEKRSQWLSNQQERLQIMKNVNLFKVENEKVTKLKDLYTDISQDFKSKDSSVESEISKSLKKADNLKTATEKDRSNTEAEKDEKSALLKLWKEYDMEIEKLKSSLPPEKFASLKNDIEKQFDSIMNEAENMESDPNEKGKSAAISTLTSTLKHLLEKLNKATTDVLEASKKLSKVTSSLESDAGVTDKETVQENTEKETVEIEEDPKHTDDDQSQSAVLDDDKLHVRIRRLDRKSTDSNGQLYEMDVVQRKKLEQAVKEKLEKAGLDTGGRRIEVNIITAGFYDNEDGKDFHALSDEETSQFQNMIMALLTGQQEAVQEMERHKKLEENYKFTWENDDDRED
ncbi:protein OS-9-like isoform X2 [Uloborus diversus]|uniref:protein OS-9-like isoform X2 n=1 Tax=Uloborus diversus TaxID=327109 RepID=UPI002409233C|nr:protein OS-9-like isoform X2 [Uloborus diversus]